MVLALVVGCNTEPIPEGPPAAVGEASIAAADLRRDVELLASDAMMGRDTADKGTELARAVLAERFTELGLTPLPGAQSYAAPFTLHRADYDPAATVLTWSGGEATLGKTMRPFPFSDPGEVTAPVVFAGYGITAPELAWDDYQGLDVKGKIVLLLRHAPHEGAEEGPWAEPGQHALFATKARNAAEHGAVGMILTTDPLHHTDPEDFRSGRLMRELPSEEEGEGRGRGPGRGRGGPPPADTGDAAPFVAVQVSREVADALLGERALKSVQEALDAGDAVNGPLDVEVRLGVAERDPVEVEAVNMVAFLEGADPTRRDEWVVVGGHYDHIGAFHGEGGDTVFNGADDNASGTAGVLALARSLSTSEPRPARSVVFVGFSGEEKGLLGSRALVEDEVVDTDKVVFMLNLDMIGRNDAGHVKVVGDGYGTGLSAAFTEANAGLDLPLVLAGDEYMGNSDHDPFYRAYVPFSHVFTDVHDDYHQLGDHADKLDYDQMERLLKLSHRVVAAAAAGALTPQFVHHIGWMGARVDLVESDGGLVARVTTIDDDSRGARAGIRAGDVLVRVDGNDLDDARRVGELLGDVEPGNTAALVLARGDERVELSVERAKVGYLGVYPDMLPEGFRSEHGLAEDQGFGLREVESGTPAGDAGLRAGDVIISFNGEPVGLGSLRRHLSRLGAGEKVQLQVIRDGERLSMPLTLGERPSR